MTRKWEELAIFIRNRPLMDIGILEIVDVQIWLKSNISMWYSSITSDLQSVFLFFSVSLECDYHVRRLWSLILVLDSAVLLMSGSVFAL